MAGTTTSGIVKVEIRGDAKQFLDVATKVRDAIHKMGMQTGEVEVLTKKATSKMSAGFSKFGSTVTGITNSLMTMKAVLGLLAVGVVAKQLLDTAITFNKWNASLEAVVGSGKEVQRVQGMLTAQAGYLGQKYIDLIEQYTKFRAAAESTGMAVGQIDKIFSAVSKGAAVFQLDARDTYEVFRALTQMISKGTISAEELRGQFGERLPGALAIMSNALGIHISQLLKMMENGQLLSDIVLPKLADGMDEAFGDKVTRVIATTQAELNRFTNAVQKFQNEVAVRGALDQFTKVLQNLQEILGDRRFVEGAAEVAKGIGLLLNAITSLADYMLSLPRELYGFILGALTGSMFGPKGAIVGGIAGTIGAFVTRFTEVRGELEKLRDEYELTLNKVQMMEKIKADRQSKGSKFTEGEQEVLDKERSTLNDIEDKIRSIVETRREEGTVSQDLTKQAQLRSKFLDQELAKAKLKYSEEKKLFELRNERKTKQDALENLPPGFPEITRTNLMKEIELIDVQIKQQEEKIAERRKRDGDHRINEAKRVNDILRGIMYDYYQSIGDEENEKIEREKERYQKSLDTLKSELDKKNITEKEYKDAALIAEQIFQNNKLKIQEEATEKAVKQINREKEAIAQLIREKERNARANQELVDKVTDAKAERDKIGLDKRSKTLIDIEKQVRDLEQAHIKLGHAESYAKEEGEKLRQVLTETADLQTWADFSSMISDNITDPLMQALQGAMSFKDAFKEMARSILQDLAQMAMKKLLFDLIFGTGKSTGAASASGGILGSIFGMANGGILSGGFRSFASGGTVNRPTLGLVGEGKYNEAIVPLPDGKNIPVKMKGGGGNQFNINVNVDGSKGGTREQNEKLGKQIGEQVRQKVREIILDEQRYGGMLNKNQYSFAGRTY